MIDGTFFDRSMFFLLGCAVGWLLGRIKCAIMKYDNDDHGIMRNNIALVVVLLLTAFAAVSSGISQAEQRENRKQDKVREHCASVSIKNIIISLNERTAYTSDINVASKEKDEAFAKLVSASLKQPPPTDEEGRVIVSNYGKSLNKYLDLLDAQSKKQAKNPYPTVDDYKTCIKEGEEEHE